VAAQFFELCLCVVVLTHVDVQLDELHAVGAIARVAFDRRVQQLDGL